MGAQQTNQPSDAGGLALGFVGGEGIAGKEQRAEIAVAEALDQKLASADGRQQGRVARFEKRYGKRTGATAEKAADK